MPRLERILDKVVEEQPNRENYEDATTDGSQR